VVRDVDEYLQYGLPVYARGVDTRSVRGRSSCAGYGIEVKLDGVRVRPGDYIFADMNGTVVIPMERVQDALKIALELKSIEERVIAAIRAGGDPIEVHEKVNYDNLLKASQPA
jgi:4-hydroxy-4-methyl-2-oxoglutarate aldolase